MTKIEAEQVGITSHRGYFRVDDGKMNLAPPSDKAKWYHLKSIDLGNGPVNDRFEGGDKVAVVTEWEWPDPTDGVTGRDFEQVAICIRAGKWRENVQARDWVGIPIAKAMHLNLLDKADKAKIKSLIKYWISTGALVSVERMDDVRRTMKPFIEVAED
jgi:hypothetical protein